MIGIDLAKISRFKNKNNNFLLKVLHLDEIEEYNYSEDKAKYLATRWAIKESIYKANNSENIFNKINIIKENRIYKFKNYIISTSSEEDFIIAIVQKGKNEHKI